MMSPPKLKFSPSPRMSTARASLPPDGIDCGGEFIDHLIADAVLRRVVEDDGRDLPFDLVA
jgi:hypothetical protein